jgi:ribosomal protein S18 acetylase RimI-like enzyme
MSGSVEIKHQALGSADLCASILAALPGWFGTPEAVAPHVETCDRSPCVVASNETGFVGLLNLRVHNPYAAEVWLMAVLPQFHRQGIGRALLQHAERSLSDGGVEYLQVKTLSSARVDEGYERTRAFYLAYGFRPLEELATLWDPQNPALMMVKSVPRSIA